MIFGLFSIYIRISKIRHVIGKIQSGLRKIDMRKSEISGIKLFRSNISCFECIIIRFTQRSFLRVKLNWIKMTFNHRAHLQ